MYFRITDVKVKGSRRNSLVLFINEDRLVNFIAERGIEEKDVTRVQKKNLVRLSISNEVRFNSAILGFPGIRRLLMLPHTATFSGAYAKKLARVAGKNILDARLDKFDLTTPVWVRYGFGVKNMDDILRIDINEPSGVIDRLLATPTTVYNVYQVLLIEHSVGRKFCVNMYLTNTDMCELLKMGNHPDIPYLKSAYMY